jgi:hypothetical protein
MTSNFVEYLRKIIPAPVRIKNIDGYVYEIESEYSILNERCRDGTVANKIYKRLKNCRKIEKLTSWYGNILKIKFKTTSKPIKEGL